MKLTLLTVALVAAAGAAAAQTGDTYSLPPITGRPPAQTVDTFMLPPIIVGGGAGPNTINVGVAPPPGGEARLDTSPALERYMRARQALRTVDTAQALKADAGPTNRASAPAQRLTGPAGIAQRQIEYDGYKNVRNLQNGPDGRWHGVAMRGNTQVAVTVDRAGGVSGQ